MRFVAFERNGKSAIGCLDANEKTIIKLAGSGLPDDLSTLIEMGDIGIDHGQKGGGDGRTD